MDPLYRIADTSQIVSPGLVVFRELVERNIDEMIRIAGDPRRLRPHCKTHKMPEVARLELARGITKHKAATFAEAEMLASAGVKDVFLAYNLVGPNVSRAIEFLSRFPDVKLSVTADHTGPINTLGQAASAAGKTIDVLLDIDTGQHRTGIEAGPLADKLYRQIAQTPGLRPGGIHLYDGHNHQTDMGQRRSAVLAGWEAVVKLRDRLVGGEIREPNSDPAQSPAGAKAVGGRGTESTGVSVPRIVCGGTGSFPIFAALDDPVIELSPGTCVFQDWSYGEMFPDLKFVPAALLLTRVISRPTPNRITLDAGYKSVASDPPAGSRLFFPDLPDAKAVLQNEEHLVLETSRAGDFQPGDELFAVPRHICPTSALHKEAFVVSQGKVVDRWLVTARDRWLTV